MESQVKLYPDGQIAEFKDGNLIRKISTNGSIHELIKALKFSRSSNFVISCDETAPTEDLPQSRGSQYLNDIGLKLLTTFEGCKLVSYDDGVGVWTIGYGHTAGIAPGMTITQAEAEEFLRQDLAEFESYVTDLVKVDLSSDQFSALVCFCYNTGPEAFGSSTLLKRLNAGDFAGATGQFPRWNKGGGEPMLGLTRRRLAEQALFRSESWEFAQAYNGPLDIPADTTAMATQGTAAPPPAQRSLQLTEPRMTGEDIRQLQLGLQKAGFALEPDGVFGSTTEVAIRQWQEREGWTVDGIVGPSLFAALI
jgi:lysozyme